MLDRVEINEKELEDNQQNELDDIKEQEWELDMMPGDVCIKIIVREDPKKESKYKSSYSYSFAVDK